MVEMQLLDRAAAVAQPDCARCGGTGLVNGRGPNRLNLELCFDCGAMVAEPVCQPVEEDQMQTHMKVCYDHKRCYHLDVNGKRYINHETFAVTDGVRQQLRLLDVGRSADSTEAGEIAESIFRAAK